MNCSILGCNGDYQPRTITHTLHKGGKLIVIDHVPAEVCTVCGDVLLSVETVKTIEEITRGEKPATKSIPLYEYA